MKLQELQVRQLSMDIIEKSWDIALKQNPFAICKRYY